MNPNEEEINIYLIRHGEAGKSWDEDPDPGLSDRGKSQSKLLVTKFKEELANKSFNVQSSPLLRAQQTAEPLQRELGFNIEINNIFAEIPSPGIPLAERKEWLKKIFVTKLADLEAPQMAWRDKIIESINDLNKHTLIFSHFMVINCVVGWLKQEEIVVNFYPDNCSVTKLSKTGNELKLNKLGDELTTVVQ